MRERSDAGERLSTFKAMNAIFEAAKAKGAVIKDEYIRVGKWPVQVLPPPGPLAEEGLAQAHELEVYGVTTRVLTPEYLCAIAIDTNRDKDRVRVAEFIRQKAVDFGVLRALVEKFELTGKAAQVSNWKEVIS